MLRGSIHILAFLSLSTALPPLCAQVSNIGLPPIRNFPKTTYRAGTQNWDIIQDQRGVVYFANNEGLLEFDGAYWTTYPLPNKTIVRSLALGPQGRIYAGGQGELGYFFPNPSGLLQYYSLVSLLPDSSRAFEDVWDIIPHGEEVFFRTKNQVFQLRNGRIEVYLPGGELSFMGRWKDRIWLQNNFRELLNFDGTSFVKAVENLPFESEISSFLPFRDDTLLLATLKDGLFFLKEGAIQKWDTRFEPFLQNNRIYCATVLAGNQIALGTTQQGLAILSPDRSMHRLLSRESKLQNNNVLSIFCDRDQNLWLGLDNGVDFMEITSPVSTIFPDGNLEATGYTALISNDLIYFGTSNGLYCAPWSLNYDPLLPKPFQMLERASGQVWSLNPAGEDLLMGHHDGAFQIRGREVLPVSGIHGSWLFIPLGDSLMLGGTYTGLTLYRKEGNRWVAGEELDGLKESSRIMIRDREGRIWVSHPYRGVYQVQIREDRKSADVRFYRSGSGLPSDLFNYVFRINGKAVVAGEKGLFQYNPQSDRFEPDTLFASFFDPELRIRYLREDARGNIWFVAGNELGVLEVRDEGIEKKIEKRIFPSLGDKLVGGFEFIYPYDARHVFLGAEKGFLLLDPGAYGRPSDKPPGKVVMREVRIISQRDSLIHRGLFSDGEKILPRQGEDNLPRIPYKWNSLRFVFSATDFSSETLEFRSFLKGFDLDWTEWQAITAREFTNLPSGKYSFLVQYRGSQGIPGDTLQYSFEVIAPWYAGTVAGIIYGLVGLGLIGGLVRFQQKRFETEKAELTSQHLKKEEYHKGMVQQSQMEIDRLQHEKLESDLHFKNRELASATMHLVQKGKMLLKIQEELNKLLKKKQAGPGLHREIQRIIGLVASDNHLDEDWKQFAYHFDQVYIDFQHRLQEQFPHLSPNDYKLCSYLRMNLTSKEIASLMNISVRGVEASRYRLRKKLGLPTEANLVEFILKF